MASRIDDFICTLSIIVHSDRVVNRMRIPTGTGLAINFFFKGPKSYFHYRIRISVQKCTF